MKEKGRNLQKARRTFRWMKVWYVKGARGMGRVSDYSGVPRKFQPVRWGVLMPKSPIRSSQAGCSKGPA